MVIQFYSTQSFHSRVPSFSVLYPVFLGFHPTPSLFSATLPGSVLDTSDNYLLRAGIAPAHDKSIAMYSLARARSWGGTPAQHSFSWPGLVHCILRLPRSPLERDRWSSD